MERLCEQKPEQDMQKIIEIRNGVTRMPEWRMAEPVNFELLGGEHIAIVGSNGSGKSMFVDMITGRHPLLTNSPVYDFRPSTKELAADNIKYVTFRDSYGDYDNIYFLQQRWNQQEIDENMPRVGDILDTAYKMSGIDTEEHRVRRRRIYELFNLKPLCDKYIILLSSGELRKLQLARTLLSSPRLLIIDNPFIGLDATTRDQLKDLLKTIADEGTLQMIIVMSKTDDIPLFITHVVEVENMRVHPKMTRKEYVMHTKPIQERVLTVEKESEIINLPYNDQGSYNCREIVKMRNVCIRYGQRTILDRLDWTIMKGERWVLCGKNGSGKSTLLSLICADNPQGYACDISLFGHLRGSGESIWDIKKHIGYVSPEMHRAYHKNLPAIQIVASGMNDSIGLYAKPRKYDYEVCRKWMDIFGLEGLYDHPFLRLSSGEQRLVLLARAFVKDPELLILDEPLHGLDNRNSRMVKEIINAFCRRKNKTMIMVTHYEEEIPSCVDKRKELIHNI